MAKNKEEQAEEVKEKIAESGLDYKFPHTMTLKKPIKMTDTQTITELVFENELDGRALVDYPLGENANITFNDMFKPIAKMTGRPQAIVMRLMGPDLMEAVSIFNYFFAESQSI